MTMYVDLVMLLNFLVDLLLVIGTNRLCGYPTKLGRSALCAGIGAIYAGACVLPGFRFLRNPIWRLVSLGIMNVTAFGWNSGTARRSVLFVFLSTSLGGIALGLGQGGFGALVASAGAVCLMCMVGFRGNAGARRYVTVRLTHGTKTRELTALQDTGNTLVDPVTGQPVLVVGADVAGQFLGLTEAQLCEPISTVEKGEIRGLRLIPYRAVGQPNGMLLAMKIDHVSINGQTAGNLVAFAPQTLGTGEYQALTGGLL